MPNEIYHRSNWGNANAEGFGDVYFDAAATNKLYNHSDYYENSDGTDKILRDLSNKASITLTPTAYSNGSLNTVIPPYQVLPTELVTNGDFSNGTTSWTLDDASNGSISVVDGKLEIVSNGGAGYPVVKQGISTSIGKKYSVTFSVTNNTTGFWFRVSQFESGLSGDTTFYANDKTSSINFKGEFTAISTTSYLKIFAEQNDAGSFKIDSISIKEIQEADFDFSRGSSATRVNEQGLIEDVQILSGNLVQNGNFATDSDWNLGTGWSISDGTANCDGSQTGNSELYQLNVFTVGKLYRLTFDLLDYSAGNIRIRCGTNTDVFRFANGTYTVELIAQGDAVLRLQADANFIGSIDNISVVEVTDDTDLPRIDYTSGFGSLLLEPQSTNLVPYSEDFSQWDTTQNATLTSDSTISPDGSVNATKITDNSTNGNHRVFTSLTTTSGSNTFSVYLKKGTMTTAFLRFLSGSDIATANVNLEEGTITATTGTAEIQNAGNDWYRCSITGIATAGTSYVYIYMKQLSAYSGTSQDLFLWGAQLEAGSYATSYIVSNSGSATTRSADIANNSGNADLINSTEGVLYAEIAALADVDGDASLRFISLSNGTSSKRITIYYFSSETFGVQLKNDGYEVTDLYIGGSVDRTQFNKIALYYSGSNLKAYLNGIEVFTNSSWIPFPDNTINTLNFDGGDGGNDFYGKTKELAVFKEALTDAELESLTSWVSFTEMATDLEYTLE